MSNCYITGSNDTTEHGKLTGLLGLINSNTSFNDVLQNIFGTFSDIIAFSHIGVSLLSDNGKALEFSYGVSKDSIGANLNKLLGYKIDLCDTNLKVIADTDKPFIISDLDAYTASNKDKILNSINLFLDAKSFAAFPLKIHNSLVGIAIFTSSLKNAFDSHIDILKFLSDIIAICLNEFIFINRQIYDSILSVAKASQSRDEFTGEHIERIKAYSGKISEFLLHDNIYAHTIDFDFINNIKRFSPLYDIGKVGITDGILLKPEKLTPEEFEEVKKHTVYGANIIKSSIKSCSGYTKSIFNMAIEITQGHHEKWDGSGYPFGIKGENIPLSARIVAIADVFDALSSKRTYKEAFSFDRSFDIILEGGGKHFDPNITDALFRHMDELHSIYMQLKTSL